MGGTTAKLVDAPNFDGRSIAATLPRSEVEEAIAGKGDVSLKLEVKARPEGAADFEAHTLEIAEPRHKLRFPGNDRHRGSAAYGKCEVPIVQSPQQPTNCAGALSRTPCRRCVVRSSAFPSF